MDFGGINLIKLQDNSFVDIIVGMFAKELHNSTLSSYELIAPICFCIYLKYI